MIQVIINDLTEIAEKLEKLNEENPKVEFERAKNNVDRAIEYLEETKPKND